MRSGPVTDRAQVHLGLGGHQLAVGVAQPKPVAARVERAAVEHERSEIGARDQRVAGGHRRARA